MSSKKIETKKKSNLIKTLQWLGVSVISVLLIVYFLVVDTTGSQTTPIIGTVNGTPIYYTSSSPYGRAFRNIEANYRQYGIQINDEMYSYIEDIAFRRAVATVLLDKIASKNIAVSDNIVVEVMKGQFVDTNGIYNDNAFQSFVRNTSKSELSRVEREIKENILSQTISVELFDNVKVNSLETERNFIKTQTKRDIEMAYIDAVSIVENSEIPASDLERYFNENKTDFAQADISYIVLESGGVADNLYKTLNDDITLFEKNALERSVDTNNYRWEYITRMEMPSESFANSIFTNSKTNTLLQPIYVNGNYYIVLLNDIRLPENYTDVKTDILKNEYLDANMNVLLEAEKTRQSEILKSAFDRNNNLSSLNNNGNIKYYKPSSPFYYNQGRLSSISGDIIPESSEEAFYRRVFSLDAGSVSDIVRLENGVAIIKVLSEEKPNMSEIANLDSYTKNELKSELGFYVENEWQNRNIEKARVKKNNIRNY